MLPDFNGLRKQSGKEGDLRSLEHRSDNRSSQSKNFQQFETIRDRKAAQSDRAPFSEIDQAFFQLWMAQPSWSPIILNHLGWQTATTASGKKVPLTLGSIESHYRRNVILGKRFGQLTNYLLIDVDIHSPFHPRQGGIEPILRAMENIGLCRYLLICSSDSGGLHIYFPLAEPVRAWGLAAAAHAALTAANVKVLGGICELFPNKKAFNAEHNGHRLPLQTGSFILDDDFRCNGNSKAVFLQQWQHCAAGQDSERLAEVLTEKPLPIPKQISISSLPPISWTAIGQSNEVMKALVNYGDRALGLKTIESLGDWMRAIAPQLPGFDQFASEESKNDLTRRNWAYRWAKSHFKSARMYAAKTSFDHNAMVAAEALERLLIALDKIVVVGRLGIKKLWQTLSDISKQLFGVGFSWGLFQKHRKLILERIESSRSLGLSRGLGEGESFPSSELVEPQNSEAGEEPKKGLGELSTARSVTPSQNQDLRPSRPPSEQVAAGAKEATELAMGTVVTIRQPGSASDGAQTRVTGKTTSSDGRLLYRLEHRVEEQALMVGRDCLEVVGNQEGAHSVEAVIQATAAQLLQVLGKANPFVGPGRWEVKRSDVPAQAWEKLRQIVGLA